MNVRVAGAIWDILPPGFNQTLIQNGLRPPWRVDMITVEQWESEEVYLTASKGDWIIRGIQGEFYPCKNDIFLATYEPV